MDTMLLMPAPPLLCTKEERQRQERREEQQETMVMEPRRSADTRWREEGALGGPSCSEPLHGGGQDHCPFSPPPSPMSPISPASSLSSGTKRTFDELRNADLLYFSSSSDTDCGGFGLGSEDEAELARAFTERTDFVGEQAEDDDRPRELKRRCDRVLASLDREIRLCAALGGVRSHLEARGDLAAKARRVRQCEGNHMLVVLMAMKWQSTALNRKIAPERMADVARVKKHIYLKNQILEALKATPPSPRAFC